MDEIQKILQRFGCTSFGHMTDFEAGKLMVQFRYKDMPISVDASFSGYAAAWLKENPYSKRMKRNRIDHEQHAKNIGKIAIYSILRDWIKGQITAIECGIVSFEGAFLGQILLPTGRTVLQTVQDKNILSLPKPE